MRISDWSSDVCSSDLSVVVAQGIRGPCRDRAGNRSGWSDQSVAAVAGTASAGGLSRQRRLGLASDPVAAGLCGDGGGVAVVGSRRGGVGRNAWPGALGHGAADGGGGWGHLRRGDRKSTG